MIDSGLVTAYGYGTSSVNSSSPFMTIEAGVDLFVSNDNKQWTPTLRLECPVHNYVGTTALFPMVPMVPELVQPVLIAACGINTQLTQTVV